LTMAAIDPSAKPYEAGKPKLATLRVLREPIPGLDSHDDSDSDSEEESDEEEEKVTKSSPKGKQSPGSKSSGDDSTTDADSDDDFDSSAEEPDESETLESFIVCTLDSDKVEPLRDITSGVGD